MRSGRLLGLLGLLALWGLLLALGSACGDDDGGGGAADGGGAGSPADGRKDAGPLVWTPKDSGQSLPPIDVPLPSTSDAGLDGRMCAMARSPLPAALLPRCAASTRDCIAACPGANDPDACRDACIQADTTPPESMYGLACDSCIYLQLFACIDAAGCHDGVADLFCCLADKCPAGSPESCGDEKCGNELMAAFTCGYYAKKECLELTAELAGQCFPADDGSDADGGT